ncbi:MAG TPA: HAMP domain-containing protein [Dissulfurispiraceae bacterium]|nr:HAMP domain-containing protein [Dissulfurispiraceae bacterium]
MAIDVSSDAQPFSSSFSGSISRRLGFAVAIFLFLILAVGGLSSFLAWHILAITPEIPVQSNHSEITEIIHNTIDHLIREVDRTVIEGSLDRRSHLDDLRHQASSTIHAFLDGHLGDQEEFPEKKEEIAHIRSLEKLFQDLDAATTRIAASVTAGRRAAPNDLEVLDGAAHQLPVLTHQLSDIHQAKIQRLVDGGVKRMKTILGASVAFLVLGGACGAVGIVLFSRTVSIPLRRLVSATLGIAAGNFGMRVPIGSRDEIGRLSQSFNDMAARLERREDELQETQVELKRQVEQTRALSRIGVEISSMLEIDAILRSVVEKARVLLQCQGGALCLFRAKGDGLAVPVVSGSVEASNVGLGAGNCGCPTETASKLSPGSVGCSACMNLEGGSPEICLTASLRRGKDILGILCVGRKEPWAFQAEDQELLDGLAAQAAIAIENARLCKEVRSPAGNGYKPQCVIGTS